MHAFKVGDFGLIACFNQSVKASFDQFADTATKNGLLTKKIGLGFFGERGFQDAGARAAEAFRVGKSQRFGFAGGVLLNGDERWSAAAFGEYFANAMSGSFG